MLLTIDECGLQITVNSIFHCHYSLLGLQMAIKKTMFLMTFFLHLSIAKMVLDFCLSGVVQDTMIHISLIPRPLVHNFL